MIFFGPSVIWFTPKGDHLNSQKGPVSWKGTSTRNAYELATFKLAHYLYDKVTCRDGRQRVLLRKVTLAANGGIMDTRLFFFLFASLPFFLPGTAWAGSGGPSTYSILGLL